MTDDEIKLIYRSHDEAMIGGKFDVIDELYADDFVNNSPGLPDFLRHGPSAVHQHYIFLHASFSAMELNVDQQTVEGDRIGFHWTWKATQSGDFLGIPATGATVQIEGFEVVQIYGGRIHGAWVIQDNASLMAQLQAAAAKKA